MPTDTFNQSALCRAEHSLAPFQSNIIVQTENGSELRAVWECCRFVDADLGLVIADVLDFWIDDRIPEGGFQPNQFGLAF